MSDPLRSMYVSEDDRAKVRDVYARLQKAGAKLVPVYNRPILHRPGCRTRKRIPSFCRDVSLTDVASAYDAIGSDAVRVCGVCLPAEKRRLR